MLATKCTSMTSRWIQSAPEESTARTSSPSLAKSDARIDGAMTSGRDANGADMGAVSEVLMRAEGTRVTWVRRGGNAQRVRLQGRKILPLGQQLPGNRTRRR